MDIERVPDLQPDYHGTLAELYALQAAKSGLKEDLELAKRYARMSVRGWARLGSVDRTALEKARLRLRELEGR